MARDLYGEMLSRALNRGAPPGHFPAYINPGEAAQLRAQGGGVPPGGGQYVANGLPSYQSTADWDAYAAMAEALGSSVDMPSAPESGDLPEFAPSRSDAARAELARQVLALREPAIERVAPPAPAPAAPSGGVPEFIQREAVAHGAVPPELGGSASVFIERREKDAAQAVEDAQRRNAERAKERDVATADMIEKNPWLTGEELDAAKMAVWQKFRQAVPNDELSALNLAHIESMQYDEKGNKLSLEKRSELLDRDISKGGVGRFSFGAGAYRRGVERGFWEGVSDFDQMRWVEYLNQPGRDGGYAVTEGTGVSMPRELMSLIPALAGTAASFMLPPAAAGTASLLGFATGAPGLLRWGGAKYGGTPLYQSIADSPLGDILRMRGDSEERVLPGVRATQRILRRPDLSQPYVGAPDVPIGELAPVTEPFVSSEEDAVEEEERPTDPLSDAARQQLEDHRSYSEEIQNRLDATSRDALRQREEALASVLIPRQFV